MLIAGNGEEEDDEIDANATKVDMDTIKRVR
jgi:hypothetical protein